jgi:hypothetical protein
MTFHLLALTKTISNPTLVKKIYNDIYHLPVLILGIYKCPMEWANASEYRLTFYQDNKLTDTAVYKTTGYNHNNG